MLRIVRNAVWLSATFAASLIILGWALTWLPPYERCEAEHKYEYSRDNSSDGDKNLSGRREIIPLFLRCEGAAIDDINGTITALATLLLFFVTGGLVYVAVQQYRTSRAQLRAYVFVSRCILEAPPKGDWKFHVVIKNFGQTPAYKVQRIAGLMVWQNLPGIDFPALKLESAFTDIPPGQKSTTTYTTTPMNPPMLNAFMQGLMAVFIFGEISYLDAFGDRHTTPFRLMNLGGPNVGMDDFAYCEEGNETS